MVARIKVSQIGLPLSFDRQFSYDNYITSSADLTVGLLRAMIRDGGETMVGLWGGQGSGKTHLLNASVSYARRQSLDFRFYDGGLLCGCNPGELDDFDQGDMLVVDNLDALCGNRPWEEKFYLIINRVRERGGRFLYSLSRRPQDLVCELADFQSRLGWGLLLELPVHGDDEVRDIVRARAKLLGMDLSDEVLFFLLSRFSRKLEDQISILRTLDRATLSRQKKVTIPLIKQVLMEEKP